MAFADIAGQAGFKIGLDKTELDKGLPEAERQFKQSVDKMAATRPAAIGSTLAPDSTRQLRTEADEVRKVAKAEEDLLRVRSRRATSVGPLRLAGIGLGAGTAIFAATQLVGDLRDQLEVTGEEALTTEGRLRNLGSAVLSGDIMGAVGAWTAEAETVDDLGITAQNAAPKLAALKDVSEGHSEAAKQAADATRQLNDEQETSVQGFGRGTVAAEAATEAARNYADVVDEAGTNNRTLAQAGIEAAEAIIAQRDAFNEAVIAAGTFGEAIGNAMSVAPGFGPPQPVRRDPRTFSLQAGVSTRAGLQDFGQNQNEIAEAQRQGDLATVARLTGGNVQTAQYRYNVALQAAQRPGLSVARREFLNKLVAARNRELQTALDAEDAAEDAITAEEKRAAAERKAARDKRIAAQKAEADREAREYREGLDTREQNLRNAYEAALATPGMRDDQKRFAALRNFLQAEGRDPRLEAGERAGYRGELGDLRRQRKDDIAKAREAANEETRDHLSAQEEVLKNRVAAAELTEKNKKDDLKALRALRDFYRRSARDEKEVYTQIEEIQFRGDATAAQKRINEILRGKKDKSDFDAGAFGRNILAAQQQIWTGMMSQFLGGTGAGNALQTHALEQFTLQGNQERAEQTRHLRTIANRGGRRDLDEAVLG